MKKIILGSMLIAFGATMALYGMYEMAANSFIFPWSLSPVFVGIGIIVGGVGVLLGVKLRDVIRDIF